MPMTDDELAYAHDLFLLTLKPLLFVANCDEDQLHDEVIIDDAPAICLCAQVEAELAELSDADAKEYLTSIGLEHSGLETLIQAAYKLLGLQSFFTAGPKEVRAWTVKCGALAPEAAGVIHSDFEHGFIKAETISFDDYISCGGEQGARDQGKLRMEGKDYVVQDGDVMVFRFNV